MKRLVSITPFVAVLLVAAPRPGGAQTEPEEPPPVVSQPGVSVTLPPSLDDPATGGLTPQDLQRALREVEAEIDLLDGETADVSGWPDLAPVAVLSPIRSVEHPDDRSITILTTTLRHTTIMLPAGEAIVDFVVGDSFYFDVRGADNVAYLRAMDDERRTTLTLVTDHNRAYSFDVFATTDHRPDEVVTVRRPVDPRFDPARVVPGFDPDGLELDFAPSHLVPDYEARIAQAEAEVQRISEDGAREEARVRELGFERFDEYLRSYPQRIQFRYRLSDEIRAAPLFVTQIWTDGVFTYLRSRAQESPAIYSLSGTQGEDPALVNVTLRPDGLYVVDHVLGAGFAQLQQARGEWYVWDVPPLDMLSEVPLPRGPEGPGWVRTRSSLPWIKRHPKLFGTLVGAGLGTFALVKVLR